ncbi:hypothetical protein CANTEDRAFT_114201 [Yamadazyma tenuis ATCC 10573]|uniref:Thioesterase domain-containing protein n=2 Tax=Candida tenuis TaxID=2315449 RepID=G3B3G3_CANTC|nr:uncharacterized protein CANTEDRAFT_114201 [Yamadazyma tenuis ATCC 10573]EGV64156.1 hypothetical protein CANTEDRAFT_114201 [Yamadazyma tenuis ATCC 10573]
MIDTVHGQLMGQALAQMLDDVGPQLSPHSVHAVFSSPVSSVRWDSQTISQGKNFINKAIRGQSNGHTRCAINCSLTSRNSYENQLKQYDHYQEEVQKKRSESEANGLEFDDDDIDIKKVDFPFRFQVPFPEGVKNLKLSKLDSVVDGDMEFKLPQGRTLDFQSDNYDKTTSFFVRLVQPTTNKFVDLAQLSDGLGIFQFKTGTRQNRSVVHTRVLLVHDIDFDTSHFLTVQARLVAYKHGQLLMEAEIFNLNGIQVATIHQQSSVIVESSVKL